MILKKTLLIIAVIFISQSYGQKKIIWAKSFLNQKAPELIVEKWLSEKPETHNKFVLIDFWATWCGPCKRAIPELNEFHEKFKDQMVFIGLSDESEATVLKLKSPIMKYYSAIDTQQRLVQKYKVKGIPHCVIIDPNGMVVWEGWPLQKGFELTENTINELIDNFER